MSGTSFFSSVLIFVGACASLSAGACFRLERDTHQRLRELLDVARGLGRHNSLRLIYDLFGVATALLQGRITQGQRGLADQLERLPHIPLLTVEARHQFAAGLHFFLGRGHLLKVGEATLQSAARIDELGGKHDRLLAQILRRTHYLYRGDLIAARREEERFDEMAALFGSRWVPDVVSVLEFLPYHLSGDVLALKRTLHRIDTLLGIAPGLKTHRDVIAAMYEGHRGRPDRALEIYAAMDAELAPFQSPIWAAARGHQAECLNALGRHREALASCNAARACLTVDDRIHVFAYQQLERETAQALAKLGRTDEAVRLSEALLESCKDADNPLLLGLLHADRARIACTTRDLDAFERHALAARAQFTATGNQALIARLKRLIELGRTTGFEFSPESGLENTRVRSTESTVSLMQSAHGENLLREVVTMLGARSAYLYLVLHGRAVLCAQYGMEEPRPALNAEVASVARELEGDVTDMAITTALAHLPEDLRQERKLLPLLVPLGETGKQLVGVLIVGECEQGSALERLDLSRIARELVASDDAATDLV